MTARRLVPLLIACLVAGGLMFQACEPKKQSDAPDSEKAQRGGGGATAPVLRVVRVPEGTAVRVDGRTADPVWRRADALVVPLSDGNGPAEVELKAAYDDKRFYLQAIWKDEEASLGWFWRYRGGTEFEEHRGEDAFAVLLPPGGAREAFAEQGCAMSCHAGVDDGPVHRWLGASGGFLDAWYWGAQTTQPYPQARDLWLRHGAEQRLRGDGQPAGSDNLENLSTEYEGPKYTAWRIKPEVQRLLFPDNVNRLTREILEEQIEGRKGWEIPRHIIRPRKGSRGDVRARGTHHEGRAWILELSRALSTGHEDDLPLVPDPLVRPLIAVAVWDGTAGAAHVRSGPIRLAFLTAP